MADLTTEIARPYKFLDYYNFEDSQIFFGRERETEILLSDVITTRLVVLFAKTGTGKTSLINAGVRPRLEELDYATFYIRVEHDPAESIRKALRKKNLLSTALEKQSLATQLQHAVTQLDKPIVVFFDQFEEFFIYVLNEDPEKAGQFISDVAKVYRNRESGVHIVFSLREKFFVEMDAFGGEIPSILHNDSTLRLQWLDKDQARDAIVRPAQRFGVKVEERLVDRLVHDLAEDRGIEPARLQIVCDTLWRQTDTEGIRLSVYEELGGAAQILEQRLEEDIDHSLDDREMDLFEKLLPELSTQRGTKYVRGLDELAITLKTDTAFLHRLADRLEDLRLIRESTHYGELYIEWTSDYLAERADYLSERMRAVSLRRLLEAFIERAETRQAKLTVESTGIQWTATATDDVLKALDRAQQDFESISAGADLIEKSLNPAAARFLFLEALQRGAHMTLWLQKASDREVEVWEILRTQIEHGAAQSKQAENAIRLLGQLRSRKAMELLGTALEKPSLRSTTLEVLKDMRTEESMRLLEKTLQQGGALALHAGMALNLIASGPPGRVTFQASEVLKETLAESAERLFLQALKEGLDMRFWFEKASENRVQVWEILGDKIIDRDGPFEEAENAIRLLGAVGTKQALELLRTALEQETLVWSAMSALRQAETKEVVELWKSLLQQGHMAQQVEMELARISESGTADTETKDKAIDVLERWRHDQGMPVTRPLQAPAVERDRVAWAPTVLDDRDWDELLYLIQEKRCTPILGAGVSSGQLPTARDIASEWALEYGYPLADSHDLARVAQFLATDRYEIYPKDAIRKSFQGAPSPDFSQPGEIHGVLADLNLPIYITTNYDSFMLQALESRQKAPRREFCRWNRFPQVMGEESVFDTGFKPSPATPLVYHLHGCCQIPQSMVLTEDDYLDFLIRLSNDPTLLPPAIRTALAGTSLLFVGYSLTDWSFRVLFRGLISSLGANLGYSSIAVQPPPTGLARSNLERATRYLDQYFDRIQRIQVRVYWGDIREFARELRERWEAFSDGH